MDEKSSLQKVCPELEFQIKLKPRTRFSTPNFHENTTARIEMTLNMYHSEMQLALLHQKGVYFTAAQKRENKESLCCTYIGLFMMLDQLRHVWQSLT
jgi:hypothetical protein